MLASVTPPFSRPSQPNQIFYHFLLHTIFLFPVLAVGFERNNLMLSGNSDPCSKDADLVVSWTRSD